MARAKSEAAQEAGVSAGVIDGWSTRARSKRWCCRPSRWRGRPIRISRSRILLDAQRAAAERCARRCAGGFSATLIDGVTGSGKTEVYFEAVAEKIRRGRQALILMPEIALTAQFLDRFAQRFGVRPAEWHSQLAPRKRARTWRAVADRRSEGRSSARARRCSCRMPISD